MALSHFQYTVRNCRSYIIFSCMINAVGYDKENIYYGVGAMSVIVTWDNEEKTILRYQFGGKWTWDDYLASLQEGRKMMASVSHYVCILNDMHETVFLPPNFVTLARNVIGSRPENTGLAIFYTSSQFFKAMYRVLESLLPDVPTNYIIATTEEEAYYRLNTWLENNSMPSKQ